MDADWLAAPVLVRDTPPYPEVSPSRSPPHRLLIWHSDFQRPSPIPTTPATRTSRQVENHLLNAEEIAFFELRRQRYPILPTLRPVSLQQHQTCSTTRSRRPTPSPSMLDQDTEQTLRIPNSLTRRASGLRSTEPYTHRGVQLYPIATMEKPSFLPPTSTLAMPTHFACLHERLVSYHLITDG